uniref:Rnh202 triple barrel domain-containing protein n=1 Tax=Sphenodon punctatus TaxID=8508 RepID=A0A8D0HA58_SPHPU
MQRLVAEWRQGSVEQWVLIASESVTELPKKLSGEPLFARQCNPALYLFNRGAEQLFEVKAFHEEYHSWFIGQTVQHDGRLLFATPVDPLFLVLLYLLKAEREQGKFQPLNQEFSACKILLQCPRVVHHDKTLMWLKKKVNQTVKVLKSNEVWVGGRVQSATFIKKDYIRYAHGLISEYVPEELSAELFKYLQLPKRATPEPPRSCPAEPKH